MSDPLGVEARRYVVLEPMIHPSHNYQEGSMPTPRESDAERPTKCECKVPFPHIICGVWTCMACRAIEVDRDTSSYRR